jgi:DNA mismatch repair protein MutL
MSETDARMSFERHATSKIRSANDLFCIRTMGFRGEALASIASIADVVLKTKRPEDELGTEIHMKGSKIESQEMVSCPSGTNFAIRSLFYNVPARRKFLKSDSTEFRHIITEFQRVALCHPDIQLVLHHNKSEVYNLPKSNLKQRISHVFGKSIVPKLASISTNTSIVTIGGYIGKPESARKKSGEQYFFINNRYMRHPYFHRAVMNAYEQILPQGMLPTYFIYFEADPETIDINIHPTKTEIKFENEQAIFQMLQSSVKEGLGKFNMVPSIDFETSDVIDIPVLSRHSGFAPPEVNINHSYNPFDNEDKSESQAKPSYSYPSNEKKQTDNWEQLYAGFDLSDEKNTETAPVEEKKENHLFQLKGKYILTSVKSGLMIIDQKRAHERILYESFIHSLSTRDAVTQKSMFPQQIDLSHDDVLIIEQLNNDLVALGFKLKLEEQSITVEAYPPELENIDPHEIIDGLLQNCRDNDNSNTSPFENIAITMAKAGAIKYGQTLSKLEMQEIIDKLFATPMPNYSPTGKIVVSIVSNEEIMERFK